MVLPWFVLLMTGVVQALDNGLALTPPMGWLSWLTFECHTDCDANPKGCLSEDLIKRTADKLVSDGYLDAGYEYVIIDDCWLEKTRGPDGRMVPDKKRFKSGMKELADYIHSKKLKFGMYQDIGNRTCAGYPGVQGQEKLDIDTFVEWEIDYLKLDGCYMDNTLMDTKYPEFGKLLNATGRPILYSCSWPAYQEPNNIKSNYSAIAESCNIWRNWDDIAPNWKSVLGIIDWFGDNQERLIPFAGPGHWNDPDMLAIGTSGLNIYEAKIQMVVWALMAAPLMISLDLDDVKPEFKQILQNVDIIAINQDKLGKQGERVYHDDQKDIWVRELSSGQYAVGIYNRNGNQAVKMEISPIKMGFPDVPYLIKDVFLNSQQNLERSESLSVVIPVKDVKLYKFTPNKEDNRIACQEFKKSDANSELNIIENC